MESAVRPCVRKTARTAARSAPNYHVAPAKRTSVMPSLAREPRLVLVQLRPESSVLGAAFMNFAGTSASRSGYAKEGGRPLLQAVAASATASTKTPIRPRLGMAKG